MGDNGVVAFAFGVPAQTFSNRRISSIASQKARELGAPVYTQELLIQVGLGIRVYGTSEKLGDPWWSTLHIAREAVAWANKNGLSTLWIVCAKPHLWRYQRDLRKAIIAAGAKIKIRVCTEVTTVNSWHEWFCNESVQLTSRSPIVWVVYDAILRTMPFCMYKRIAD